MRSWAGSAPDGHPFAGGIGTGAASVARGHPFAVGIRAGPASPVRGHPFTGGMGRRPPPPTRGHPFARRMDDKVVRVTHSRGEGADTEPPPGGAVGPPSRVHSSGAGAARRKGRQRYSDGGDASRAYLTRRAPVRANGRCSAFGIVSRRCIPNPARPAPAGAASSGATVEGRRRRGGNRIGPHNDGGALDPVVRLVPEAWPEPGDRPPQRPGLTLARAGNGRSARAQGRPPRVRVGGAGSALAVHPAAATTVRPGARPAAPGRRWRGGCPGRPTPIRPAPEPGVAPPHRLERLRAADLPSLLSAARAGRPRAPPALRFPPRDRRRPLISQQVQPSTTRIVLTGHPRVWHHAAAASRPARHAAGPSRPPVRSPAAPQPYRARRGRPPPGAGFEPVPNQTAAGEPS
jgi:hypothetical protein